MSNSAITTQTAQLKAGNVQNQADTSSIYSAGQWSFKNSTAVTSVTITDAGAVTLGPSGFTGNHVVNGNVGIGTASKITGLESFTQFTVSGSNGGIAINSTNTAAGDYSRLCFTKQGATGNEGVIRYNTNDYHMGFFTNATERMRIDASGALLIGTTSLFSPTSGTTTGVGFDPSGYLLLSRTSNVMNCRRVGSDGDMINFYRSPTTTTVGSITVTASSTAYVTSSDYRLKEDIQPMAAALSKVAVLKPCTYRWKVDGSGGEGFIAHELAEVCPAAVTGEKDAVNEDGSIKSQGIDPSKLVALLTAAIQELSTKNDALEARLAALESKP